MRCLRAVVPGVVQPNINNPGDPNSPQPLGTVVREAVPYNSAHPYDYYDRPVYKNMTFTNVKIPKGANALFQNCKFAQALSSNPRHRTIR